MFQYSSTSYLCRLALCGWFLVLIVCVIPPLYAQTSASESDLAPEIDLSPAEILFEAGEFAEVEKLLLQDLRNQPRGPNAAQNYLLLGKSQAKQDRFDEALRSLSGLVFRFPKTEQAAQALEEQALLQLRRRNPTAAQELRDELLDRHPKSPTTASVWTSVADGLFEKEEFEEALEIYQKIEFLLPPESLENLNTTRILVTADGDPAKILPLAEKALNDNNRRIAKVLYEQLSKSPKAGRDLPKIHTRLGWSLFLEGDAKNRLRAEQLWQDVVSNTQPTDSWYAESRWHLVQMAAGPRKNWKEAISICDLITKEQDRGTFPHEQALFAKAWLLTVQDQGQDAVDAFDDLADAYPEKIQQPAIKLLIERALASASSKPVGPPKTDSQLAEIFIADGKFAEAEKLLKLNLRAHPTGPDAAQNYLLLAQSQAKQVNIDEALRNLSGLVFRFPKTEQAAQAIEQQALLHEKRRNPSAAKDLREDLLKHYPESPTTASIWPAAADRLFLTGNFKEALEIYQQIESLLSAKSLKNLKSAKILATASGDPKKILKIAEISLNDGDLNLAKLLYGQLTRSARAKRRLAEINTKLGWCLFLQGGNRNFKKAGELWRDVIRENRPDDPWYAESKWNLVQMAADIENDLKKAISLCDSIVEEQAVGTFPHEQALFTKAWLLTMQDQGQAAVSAFNEFAAAYPEKMQHPPIKQFMKLASESAEENSGGAR